MGIDSHGNNGHSHSHTGCFPFLSIPIPNFVTNSHSHGNPMGFPFALGIPFPWSSLLGSILRIEWCDQITNDEVMTRSGQTELHDAVATRRCFTGHILRLPSARPSLAIEWRPEDDRRRIGRPNRTWQDKLKEDLETMDIDWNDKRTIGGGSYWAGGRSPPNFCPSRLLNI